MKPASKHAPGNDLEFVKRVLILFGLAALVAAAWVLVDVLLLLFGAVLVAIMLRAIADQLIARLRIPEAGALALAILLVIAVIAGAVLLLGPELSLQMRALFERLPQVLDGLANNLQLGSFMDLLKASSPASTIGNLVSRVFVWATTVVGALASFALVVFAGVYLAADPQLYREGLLKLVPQAVQANVNATLDDAGQALRRWLGGQLIAMTLVGVLAGAGLWAVGVPFAFALGLITGLAEFVPVVGPLSAAVPAVLIASTQDGGTLLWAIGVLVIVQQIESNLIAPLIAGRTVAVAPAVGLFAVVAMGILFGPLGVIFGFPLTVVIDVAVRRLYVLDTLGEPVEILGKDALKSEDERPAPSPGKADKP